jgi:hypothetical protein
MNSSSVINNMNAVSNSVNTNNWIYIVFYSLILSSSLITLFSIFSNNSVAINASMIGYSTLIVCIVVLMGITYLEFFQSKQIKLLMLIFTYLPYLLIISLLILSLWIIGKWKNIIISNKDGHYYTTFSTISIVLILTQIGIIMNELRKSKKSAVSFTRSNTAFLYLLSILNFIVLVSLIISLTTI